MAGGVSAAALLTLVSIGLVNALVWYGRLHYRLLKPAIDPQPSGELSRAMTRTLVLIAFSGFILAVACIAGAVALGRQRPAASPLGRATGRSTGTTAIATGATTTTDVDARRPVGHPRDRLAAAATRSSSTCRPTCTFTQAPGPGKLVITGPKDAVDRIELSGGAARLQGRRRLRRRPGDRRHDRA